MYDAENDAFFYGKLPPARIEFIPNLTDEHGVRCMGLKIDGAPIRIFLDAKNQDNARIWQGTIFHESCHIYVDKYAPEFDEHGPHFQSCMMGLAKQDAFHDIW